MGATTGIAGRTKDRTPPTDTDLRIAVRGLTHRELGVLELIADGVSNQGIADALFVTTRTVETHVASIFLKLGLWPDPRVHRRVRAVRAFSLLERDREREGTSSLLVAA